MAASKAILVFISTALAVGGQCAEPAPFGIYDDLIKWVPYSNVVEDQLIPAGREKYHWSANGTIDEITYVARGTVDVIGVIPGKYTTGWGVTIGYNGQEIRPTQFEVLTYTAGSISWVPKSCASPAANKVLGGFDHDSSSPLYICRALYDPRGILVPGKLRSSGECIVPMFGKEHVYTDNYEVLMVSPFGEVETAEGVPLRLDASGKLIEIL